MIEIKEHLKLNIIEGKYTNYGEIISDEGYCFYDKNMKEEEIIYYNSIKNPSTNIENLKKQYIVVKGNAEQLNEEIAKRMEEKTRKEMEEHIKGE